MKINCSQFSDLITFYLNNELSDKLKKAFEEHLSECNECTLRFKMLHSIVDELRHIYDEISIEHDENDENMVQTLIDEEIDEKNNLELSAYIDNELADEFSIKIRKAIIAKPNVRNKIEKLYKIQKCLKNSYVDGQNKMKKDYSRFVLKKLNICKNNGKTRFYCILFVSFIILLIFFSIMVIVNIV